MTRLHLIAHNIRSRENVGSLFRTCDSLGVHKLWLTGYTPAPPDAKLSKVALGAEAFVAYEQVRDIDALLRRLRQAVVPVYALELHPQAQNLSDVRPPAEMALLLGTETTGVPPSLLAECHGAIQIVQQGKKESMNVAVAAGIASWVLLNG